MGNDRISPRKFTENPKFPDIPRKTTCPIASTELLSRSVEASSVYDRDFFFFLQLYNMASESRSVDLSHWKEEKEACQGERENSPLVHPRFLFSISNLLETVMICSAERAMGSIYHRDNPFLSNYPGKLFRDIKTIRASICNGSIIFYGKKRANTRLFKVIRHLCIFMIFKL